jgi:hypothetical protein
LQMYQSELVKERAVVENLEVSAANLQKVRGLTSAKHKQTVIECDLELEKLHLSIDVLKQAIEHDHCASETKKNSWDVESVQFLTELQTSKDATNEAEAKLNELDSISRDLEKSSQERLRQELMHIEEQKTKCTQEIDAKVASILKSK